MALSLSVPQRRKVSGFTLIELMIVVAIIGILAGLAYPSYTDYVRRGQAAEAFSQLSTWHAKMEQYYQDHRNYGNSSACSPDAAWAAFPSTDNFDYACTTASPYSTYSIKATGKSGHASFGNEYTIAPDESGSGARSTTKFKGTTVAKTCWYVKGTEC